MKLLFMKEDALTFFKENLEKYYTNYFTKPDNSWMVDAYKGNPFEEFIIDGPDLELADPAYYTPGELELENCKRLYMALKRLSPSQAADERLWAGLCNGVYYDYLKRRFNNYELHTAKRDIGEIKMRFFFSERGRSGIYANPMSKWWWIGKLTFDSANEDHFEKLDIIGGADFSTKTWIIFNSYTFSSNPEILDGIIDSLKYCQDNGIKLVWKKEFRAAMKYLNAYGGGVLLDMLTAEEVKNILVKKYIELIKGNYGGIKYGTRDDDEPDSDDTEIQVESEEVNDYARLEMLEQELGVGQEETVYISYRDVVKCYRISDGKEFVYEMPMDKITLENAKPEIIKKLLGHKLNDQFRGTTKDYFKITAIEKR